MEGGREARDGKEGGREGGPVPPMLELLRADNLPKDVRARVKSLQGQGP